MAIADLDEKALYNAGQLLKSENEDRVLVTQVDVSKRQQVDDWVSSIIERFGRLDGAANCAGIIGKHHGTRAVEELDDDQWSLIMVWAGSSLPHAPLLTSIRLSISLA